RAIVRIGNAIAVRDRPSIEPAFDDAVELAGWKVVTQQIAPVVGRVQYPRAGLPVETDGVPQPGGIDLLARAIQSGRNAPRPPSVPLYTRVAARSNRDVQEAVRTNTHRT